MNKYKFRILINTLLGGNLLFLYKLLGIKESVFINKHKVTYYPNTEIGTSLFFNGCFEQKELETCRKYINENSIVVDIGANIGIHSIYYSQVAKGGLVIAFEPSIETYALLLANITDIDNILPVNIAVSNYNGIADFYMTSDNAYSSLIDTKRKTIKKIKKTICCKLDDLLLKLNFDHIDFVKIDVEGLEHSVIAGMKKIIQKFRPVIFCEIYQGTDSNRHPDETIKLVSGFGYDAFILDGGTLVKYTKHNDIFYNYFFIPDDRTQS